MNKILNISKRTLAKRDCSAAAETVWGVLDECLMLNCCSKRNTHLIQCWKSYSFYKSLLSIETLLLTHHIELQCHIFKTIKAFSFKVEGQVDTLFKQSSFSSDVKRVTVVEFLWLPAGSWTSGWLGFWFPNDLPAGWKFQFGSWAAVKTPHSRQNKIRTDSFMLISVFCTSSVWDRLTCAAGGFVELKLGSAHRLIDLMVLQLWLVQLHRPAEMHWWLIQAHTTSLQMKMECFWRWKICQGEFWRNDSKMLQQRGRKFIFDRAM